MSERISPNILVVNGKSGNINSSEEVGSIRGDIRDLGWTVLPFLTFIELSQNNPCRLAETKNIALVGGDGSIISGMYATERIQDATGNSDLVFHPMDGGTEVAIPAATNRKRPRNQRVATYLKRSLASINDGQFTTQMIHPGVIHSEYPVTNEYEDNIDHLYWYFGGGATHALLAEIERHRNRDDTRPLRSALGALKMMEAIARQTYRVRACVEGSSYEGADISVMNWPHKLARINLPQGHDHQLLVVGGPDTGFSRAGTMLRFAAAYVTKKTDFLVPLLETHPLKPDAHVNFQQTGDDSNHWMIGSEIHTGPSAVTVTANNSERSGLKIGIHTPKNGTLFSSLHL